MSIRWLVLPARCHVRRRVSDLLPRVFIVVAIEAEQLPVTAVGGIVVVIVVLMMDRELAQLFAGTFASAPRTTPGIQLQRLPPLGLLLLCLVEPRFGDYPILAVKISECLLR